MRRLTKEQIENARENGLEKIALAWASGEDIEFSTGGDWLALSNPSFCEYSDCYRIKPKPKPVMVKVDRDSLLAHLANYIDSRGFMYLEHIKTMLEEAEVVE